MFGIIISQSAQGGRMLKPNPEYVKKLEQIENEDNKVHFKNMDEFDRQFEL